MKHRYPRRLRERQELKRQFKESVSQPGTYIQMGQTVIRVRDDLSNCMIYCNGSTGILIAPIDEHLVANTVWKIGPFLEPIGDPVSSPSA